MQNFLYFSISEICKLIGVVVSIFLNWLIDETYENDNTVAFILLEWLYSIMKMRCDSFHWKVTLHYHE